MQKANPGTKNNLIHSNSTSHLLHREQRRTEQLEETKKRFSSSEGRFHIIDERSKDSSASSDTDEDGPLPNAFSVPNRLPPAPTPAVGFSQSVNLPHGHMSSVASASRFRIVPVVPVESRYKRGRWDCFDYYQKEIPRGSKVVTVSTAPRTLSTLTKNDRAVCSWTTELAPMPATAPPHGPGGPTFKFDETEKTLPKYKALNVVVVEQVNMTPTEMLQSGLATTLNMAEIKKNSCVITSSAASHNGNSPHSVAIDSKIEQAMDLVKSHLMFAVREEVEGLRQKIGELETHIHNLETENAILKNHISPDVLGGLHTSSSK